MKNAWLLALAAGLVVSSVPGCLSPIHSDRREVTMWNLEHFSETKSVRDVPVVIFAAVSIPAAWCVDALIVNPIDSYKGATLDVHGYAWDDEMEGERQAYVKSGPRSWGSGLLWPVSFIVRANAWVAPHDAKAWKQYWNEHVEVTAASVR